MQTNKWYWDTSAKAFKYYDNTGVRINIAEKVYKIGKEYYYLQNNGYTLENYLKSQNSSMSDFNKQLETTAKTDVGKQLVYGAVAEKENITVSDKQYKEEVKTYLTNYNCKNEKELSSTFKDYYGVDAKTIITEDILYKNVKNFLIKNVKES